MGGGILQLVSSNGIENLYLNIDPQITHWKTVYRRHTEFSLFDRNITLKNISYGDTITSNLKNIGDVTLGLSLDIELSDIDLEFDAPTVFNIRTLLQEYGITWDTSYDDIKFVTTTIYNTEIEPLIEDKLDLNIENYSYYNNLLSLVDAHVKESVDVFSGSNYLIKSTAINHNAMITGISNVNITIANKLSIIDKSDVYVFVDSNIHNITSSTTTFTMTPNDDLLFNSDNTIMCVSGRYLDIIKTYNNNALSASGSKYIMLKKNSITNDYDISQSVTATGNIYLSSGSVQKFPGVTQNRLISNINNNVFVQDGNSKIELFDYNSINDEKNLIFFLVYVGVGASSASTVSVDTTSLNMWRVNPSNASTDILYFSQSYLTKYNTDYPINSGDYVAINRLPFITDGASTTINITMSEYGYQISSGVNRLFNSSNLPSSSETFYVVIHNSNLVKDCDNNTLDITLTDNSSSGYPVKFIGQTYVNTLTSSSTISISDSYIQQTEYTDEPNFLVRANSSALSIASFQSETNYFLVPKTSATYNSGSNTLTFTKENILRTLTDYRYNFFKTPLIQTNTLIDTSITSVNKDSTNVYDLITYYRTEPFLFLMQIWEHLYQPMTSPQNYNIYIVLHRAFSALLKDILSDSDRNIILCTMIDVINKTYDKYLENILNYDKVYSDYLFTHSDSSDDDSDVVVWTDTYTGETSNKKIRISLARENIKLIHVIDMAEYHTIPYNYGTIKKYFDHIINRSYLETSYTNLDNYVIYTNYIATVNNPINNLLTENFIENQAIKIVSSMYNNYFSNLDILYRTIESIENIKGNTKPIHMSSVYQSTNIYSNVNYRTYGKLDHNNNTNQIINIIDDILNGEIQDTQIFYYDKIKDSFIKFIHNVNNNSNDIDVIDYFDKMVYWNDLMTSSNITSISETSMKATLDIQSSSANYITAFTNKRAILSHLPYALVQNIPYAIDTIILNGGLLSSSSGVFAFPQVINSEKTAFATLIRSLFYYVHDGSFSDTITISDTTPTIIYTLDKGTILDDIEDEMFIKVIGSDKSDITTYYHKDYINSLKYDSDSTNSYYVILPFFIETLSSLPAENGFLLEIGLTPVEYIVKFFKRLFKNTIIDLIDVLNTNSYNKNISILTGGDISVGSASFSFFQTFYDEICKVLDGYLQTNIIKEKNYSNNMSLFTDRHVFSNIRLNNHNYRLLDIQTAIWNNIQKKNIRAFNELYYDTILSRDLIKTIGGNSILTLFDRLMVVITGISGSPTYYQTGYTDLLGNVYINNSSNSRTSIDPIGFTGLDYYRLRDNTSFDTRIKDRIKYELEYFNYLYQERYQKLKPILNVKNIEISNSDYMFASTQDIIMELAEKLVDDYDIDSNTYYSYMTPIIGHVSGGDVSDFIGVANEIHNECVTAFDLIANTAGNHTDTPYAKIYLASTDIVNNQFSIGDDPYLYEWFDDNKTVVSMTLPFTLYQTIDDKLTPQLLYSHSKRFSIFNNYYKYSDVILVLFDALVETYTNVSERPLYSKLNKNYSSNIYAYNDIVNVCSQNIEENGDSIMKLGILSDGGTSYKVSDSQVISDVTWKYRYKIIEDGDVSINDDEAQLYNLIYNMINRIAPKFKYVEELGHKLINESVIRFDSKIISKINYDVLSHHARVNNNIEQSKGYNISIGNTDEMKNYDSKQKPIKKLNIPLCHWFNNKNVNALSTVSLFHTDVLHHLVLSNYDDLIIIETGAKYIRKPKIKCSLLGRFAYVGNDERRKLAMNRIEYLIPMYQYAGEFIFENKDIYKNNKINMKLNFSDPTKYIWWKIEFHKKSPTVSEKNDDKFNWTVRELKHTDTLYYRTMDECKFKFSGVTREDYKDYTYWNAYHPFTRGINNLNKGEFAFVFALHPLQFQPSGHSSMSTISEVFCIMKLHDAAINALNNGYIMTVKWWSLTIDIVVVMSGIGDRLFFNS